MAKTNPKKTPVNKKAPVKKSGSSKGGQKNIDWYSARKLYLEDNTVTFEQIAKIVGSSKTAVGNRAKAEDWTGLRQDLHEKAFSKFTEKLLDTKSNANNRHLTHWQNLQALANTSIVDMAERNYERNKAGYLVLDANNNPIRRRLIRSS